MVINGPFSSPMIGLKKTASLSGGRGDMHSGRILAGIKLHIIQADFSVVVEPSASCILHVDNEIASSVCNTTLKTSTTRKLTAF